MEELLEELILELKESRKSFAKELTDTRASLDSTASSIRWTKINTAILYCLVAIVFLLGAIGAVSYLDERRKSCGEHNDIRSAVTREMENNAAAIGIALQVVSNADQEKFELYLQTYQDNITHSALDLQSC